MEIHPDAPTNPFEEELTEMVNYERAYAHDFRRAGKIRHIEIAEHNEQILKSSLIDLQNTCLPTLNHLRDERNIARLQ